ncbi:MAG: PRC-barrel domain-containing protein [Anaerolineaceae bacterium]|jgi:uncharacterized protein YrrD
MLTSKDITGRLVISIDDGKKLGTIEDVYLDLDMRQVAGVYLGSEGLLRRKEKVILRADVQVLGVDAWLVSSAAVVTPLKSIAEGQTFTLVDNIRGREIQTDGGTRMGVVEDVILDLDLQVLGFQLGKVYVQGPLAQKKAIVRDAVLDPGGKNRAMIVDLVMAESSTIPAA